MSTCIYYDLDEVTFDDVRRARALAGSGAAEFVARGTLWPSNLAGPGPAEVPNSRDFDYHEELMDWVDRVWSALDKSEPGAALRGRCGASLLEIARFHFFYEYAQVEQRWRALGEIRRIKSAGRVVWVAPAEHHRDLQRLAATDASLPIELIAAAHSEGMHQQLWRRAKSLGRRAIDGVLDRALRLKRDPMLAPLSRNTRVVFVEYYPNSAQMLVPVAEELRKKFGIEPFWLAAREPVRQILQQLGIQSRLLRELAPIACSTQNHLSREARTALRMALELLADDLYRGTGAAAGRSYLLPAVYDQLSDSLNQAAYWLDALTEALARLRPQCVVSTTYSSIVGRAAALAGRAQGARSIYVQHGLFPDRRYFANFCNDRLLLWGQCNRRTMIRSGVADERIRVVGATIYDGLERESPAGDAPFPAPGQPLRIALMASRTGGMAVGAGSARQVLTTVTQALGDVPGAQLTVKIHPGDHTGLVERTLAVCQNCTVIRSGSSQELIQASDVVIVVSSTTGLEACVAGKPLVVLRMSGVSDAVPYDAYGAAETVAIDGPAAAARLAETLNALRASPVRRGELAAGRQRLVDDMLNGLARNAAELTAQGIVEMMASQEIADPQDLSASHVES